MDDKDRSSYEEKVTPLFRDPDRDVYEDFDEADSRINVKDDVDQDEEFAAETAVVDHSYEDARDADDDDAFGRGLGWLSFILSIIGLFFLPVIMGTAGIIIGFIAMRQGARVLGGWAIAVGIIALILRLFTGFFIY